jgi:hypothetical protein
MDAAKSVTANFAAMPSSVRLTVTKAGAGSGTVTSNPPGISCTGGPIAAPLNGQVFVESCTADYAAGTPVTLTATATEGSTFTGWSGACTGTATCILSMDANKSVTAAFITGVPQLRRLTVSKIGTAGTGTGTVLSSPAGIDCGTTCAADFPAASQVTLTAVADAGSAFVGWSSACTAGAGEGGPIAAGSGNLQATCRLTMDANKSVTATFRQQTFSLHVDKIFAGGGSLTVTSEPRGIACPSTCDAQFPAGTVVTLTATPSASAVFAGWADACSGTERTCTLLMDDNKRAKAYYGSVSPPPPPSCTTASVTITVHASYGFMTWLNIQGVGAWVVPFLNTVVVNNVPRGVYTLTIITTARGQQEQSINVGCASNLVVFR